VTDTDFEDVADGFTNSTEWYAAVQEARAKMHREQSGGVDVAAIGHEAWRTLTPVQQAHALPDLFVSYIVRLHEEERARQLQTAAADPAKTYLEADDEFHLQDAVAGIDLSSPEVEIHGVPARALSNVLSELDLLRHRLRMANTPERS
jgi:hypothetical protein